MVESGGEEYHWQDLPKVAFLSRQIFGCDKHMFVMTNMTKKSFVTTKYACDKPMFVTTKLLLRQT